MLMPVPAWRHSAHTSTPHTHTPHTRTRYIHMHTRKHTHTCMQHIRVHTRNTCYIRAHTCAHDTCMHPHQYIHTYSVSIWAPQPQHVSYHVKIYVCAVSSFAPNIIISFHLLTLPYKTHSYPMLHVGSHYYAWTPASNRPSNHTSSGDGQPNERWAYCSCLR